MNNELTLLFVTAASLGFIHTVLGVDHYVPFIALSKALNWSKLKTYIITTLCGIGHVLSTVVIGIVGIVFGLSLSKLESIENARGEIAGWFLIAFGIGYTIYGVIKSRRNSKHSHPHIHLDKLELHNHEHTHNDVDHIHPHESASEFSKWTLFIIFVFGPCEALIPILMIPAADHSIPGLILVVLIFGIATIITMLVMVTLGIYGMNLLPEEKLGKHVHTFAGVTILLCGIGVQFLGL